MSSELAFRIFGGSIGVFSAGTVMLAFKISGKKLLYRSLFCDGTSTSSVYSVKPFTIKNDSGNENILFCLDGVPVKVQIGNGFINPQGDFIDFSLEIYNPNKSEPIYKTSRSPTVAGFSCASISVKSNFQSLDLSPSINVYGNKIPGSGYESMWNDVWNGKTI